MFDTTTGISSGAERVMWVTRVAEFIIAALLMAYLAVAVLVAQ